MTVLVNTGQSTRTISILLASVVNIAPRAVSITNKAFSALTGGPVVSNSADCIFGAVAGVDTLLVPAGKSCVTFRIAETFWSLAFTLGVTKVLRQTGALGFVITD